MNKLRIIGRQRDGINIIGYIMNEIGTNNILSLSKNKVYELAFEKRIVDVIIQNYNGKITMKGVGYKISELPCYDKNGKRLDKDIEKATNDKRVIINGKCSDGKNIIAYRLAVVENNSIVKEQIVSRQKVMDLAKNGMISNARYQKSNGMDILRGVDCKLSALPSIEYTKV